MKGFIFVIFTGFLLSIEFEIGDKFIIYKKPEIKSSKEEKKEGVSLVFIDMERVFREHPIIKNAKKKYEEIKLSQADKIKKLQEKLSSIETELEKLANEFESADESELPQKEKVVELKMEELLKYEEIIMKEKKRFADELAEFEKSQTELAIRELYKLMKKKAKSDKIMVIIDKSSVIYGKPEFDITEKILQEIKESEANR